MNSFNVNTVSTVLALVVFIAFIRYVGSTKTKSQGASIIHIPDLTQAEELLVKKDFITTNSPNVKDSDTKITELVTTTTLFPAEGTDVVTSAPTKNLPEFQSPDEEFIEQIKEVTSFIITSSMLEHKISPTQALVLENNTAPSSLEVVSTMESKDLKKMTATIAKKRRQFKLTMRQGLVMNQVLGFYGLTNVKSPLCKKHTDEFKSALRAFEAWALNMVDSSSKLSAGMFFGNLVDLGSYEQCVAIEERTESGLIRGQMCTLRMIPGVKLLRQITSMKNISERRFQMLIGNALDGAQAMWSVCVPHTCGAADVLPHFNRTIREMTEGLELEVALHAEDCHVRQNLNNLDVWSVTFIMFLLFIVLNVIIASFLEWKTDAKNAYISIFSFISNGKLLFANTKTESELSCIHGIRFLSELYILAGHRYLMGMAFPTVNSLYILDWVLKYTTMLIIGGSVSVDSFLYISALLVSYHFFIAVNKYRRFDVFAFYFHRFMRITPALMIIVFGYALLIGDFGSGPIWMMNMKPQIEACRRYWWSTMVHLQAYANPKTICVPQAWYLSLEMVFYYFAPIILYPMWKWPVLGYANYALIYSTSVAVPFYLAWTEEYSGAHPVTRNLSATKYYIDFYIRPHARAATYIMGLGVGYVLFMLRGRKLNLSFAVNMSGWLTAAQFLLYPVFGAHMFQEETHVYNRLVSSAFLAMSRSAWTLGLSWVIFACETGNGGFINTFLSLHLFRVLGRLCYAVFLLHFGFQYMKSAAAKGPGYFSDFEMIFQLMGDITVNGLASIVFVLFFEYPFTQMSRMFLSRKSAKTGPSTREELQIIVKENR